MKSWINFVFTISFFLLVDEYLNLKVNIAFGISECIRFNSMTTIKNTKLTYKKVGYR